MKRTIWMMTLFAAAFLLLSVFDVQAQDTPRADKLTTPQLINAAHWRGEISADERIRYLAYALYERESLPAEFDSPHGWHGTTTLLEVRAAYEDASLSRATSSELDRLFNSRAETTCDAEDGAFETTSTHFYFNYGTVQGGLSINDYVTSMENAFAKIVTEYGWAQPPLCTADDVTEGGCDFENDLGDGSALFPVLVANISSTTYGYVAAYQGAGNYAGVVGDNPNTTAVETAAKASCMVLNADFSQFPENTPLENLDATTSHEYVHAVQNGYGDPESNGAEEDILWYESVAAYFEDEMNDSANTANLYLWPRTTNCLGEWPNGGDPYGISEYANFIFFRHLAENTGGANVADGGENTIQALWANIGAGQTGLDALDNALMAATTATTLPDAFHDYSIAVKGSKSCGGDYAAPYCFEEGDTYVATGEPRPGNQGSIESSPNSFAGSVNDHYAINYVGLPDSGQYTVSLENTAASGIGLLRASVVCDTGAGYDVTHFSADLAATQSGSVGIDANSCTSGVTLVISNIGTTPGVEPSANACPATSRAATTYNVSVANATTNVALGDVATNAQASQWVWLLALGSLLLISTIWFLPLKARHKWADAVKT